MKYLIMLEPIETFFFGGDRTFGNDSYIAFSRRFPQQTALLGMIRREILLEEKVLIRDKEKEKIVNKIKKEILVGKDEFSMDKNEKDYGMINYISEVFLYNGDEVFYLVKDFFDYEIEFNPVMLKKDGEVFSLKEGIKEVLISKTKKIDLSEVFEEVIQVGNQKNKKEDAFFKKFSYKLKNFKFAFKIDTNYEIEKLDGKIVQLGAERSKFKLNVIKNYDKEIVFPKKDFSYLVLLSDAYIEKEKAEFAITSEISFAYNKKPGGFKKSKTYYFYEKGSIFINYSQELVENLISFKNLTQIGYNKFKEIK